jgi:hypothetical protein
MGFVIGGIVAWLAVSFFYSQLLPVLSWPSLVAVPVGGIIGVALQGILMAGQK